VHIFTFYRGIFGIDWHCDAANNSYFLSFQSQMAWNVVHGTAFVGAWALKALISSSCIANKAPHPVSAFNIITAIHRLGKAPLLTQGEMRRWIS
jgi:hypothetical protein